MRVLIFVVIFLAAVMAQDPCPDQFCFHSTQFWQTYNCFAEGEFQVSWPFGGITTGDISWSGVLGWNNSDVCDLRASGVPDLSAIIGDSCLADLQGTDFLFADLTSSTNQTEIMLQAYYTFLMNFIYNFQVGKGPCPVGPGLLPPGVPVAKRLTLVELQLLAAVRGFQLPFLDLAFATNCDFSLASAENISEVLAFYQDLNTVTCDESFDQCDDECVHSQGYWKNHNRDGKNPSQQIPWPTTGTASEDNLLCGVTWVNWLNGKKNSYPQFGNAQFILARQLLAANLNVLKGNCLPSTVADTISEATNLFESHCGEAIHPSSPVGQLMTSLASMLEEYNTGLAGAVSCD
jgi:hypothetical protein